MEIDWQQSFYITTTFAMVINVILGIVYIWILYNVTLILKKINKTVERGDRIMEDIDYFQRGVRQGIVGFLLKIFDKGGKND